MENNTMFSELTNQTKILLGVIASILIYILFTMCFFYAEPGYLYHVRTLTGTEKMVNDTGYAGKWFGRVTEWKKAITVQTVIAKDPEAETEDESSSRTIDGVSIVFLGNVDAKVEVTSRFRIPEDEVAFLKFVREYRTPANLLSTALVPALKDTIQSTGSLMTADDYYGGGRSQFSNDFETQMRNGSFVVRRVEERQDDAGHLASKTAIAQQGTEQGQYGDNTRSSFKIEKITDTKGVPLVKKQTYTNYGITLIEARVTNIVPNADFLARMKKVQEGMAGLAIARQDRLKQEELKLFTIANGEREREEKRQGALMEQAVQTTNAETTKQLAITAANQRKEQAELDKQTAQLLFEKAEIDAQSKKILAEAESFAKEQAIKSDNGLQAKLDALVAINQHWAEAAKNAPVPSVFFGAGEGGVGRQSEISSFMSIMLAKSARDLAADVNVEKKSIL
jgi:hypothetical protein